MSHPLLADEPVVIELPVAWGEMDAYSHVNNAVYFRYFESSRLEYLRRIDWFAFEEETGIGPILAATSARYRRPLQYPDTISVSASVVSIEADRLRFAHKVVSHGQNALTTEGESTVVTYHYAEKHKVPVPEELRRRIEEMQGK